MGTGHTIDLVTQLGREGIRELFLSIADRDRKKTLDLVFQNQTLVPLPGEPHRGGDRRSLFVRGNVQVRPEPIRYRRRNKWVADHVVPYMAKGCAQRKVLEPKTLRKGDPGRVTS